MPETILEEYQMLNGNIGQTVRREDGSEYQREYSYTCSICGAPGDTPFPTWAISCYRSNCRANEITDRD